MSKYIIEIEEKPLCVFDKDTQTYFPRLWRVKGFNSLVFDEDGLSRLEELNSDYINEHYGQLQDEAYQRGYKDCETRYCSFDACPNRQAEYQRGLDDAWKAARKIVDMWDRIDNDELLAIFGITERIGYSTIIALFGKQTASEALEKLKAYEEKQDDKIDVGDEFVTNTGERFVVLRVDENGEVDRYFDSDGKTYRMNVKYSSMKKTGRHFDIASILEEMKE